MTAHFRVSGRVQGVFFRAATRRQADRLGVTGWVRNLPDGGVEGMARAAAPVLEDFRRWLQRGPEHARVLNLEWKEAADQEFAGFEIR